MKLKSSAHIQDMLGQRRQTQTAQGNYRNNTGALQYGSVTDLSIPEQNSRFKLYNQNTVLGQFTDGIQNRQLYSSTGYRKNYKGPYQESNLLPHTKAVVRESASKQYEMEPFLQQVRTGTPIADCLTGSAIDKSSFY